LQLKPLSRDVLVVLNINSLTIHHAMNIRLGGASPPYAHPPPPREIATLLSGGIDSGAVTTFAVLVGPDVTAYSAGSPWGNEHEQAAELAGFLGIRHVQIDFSVEELLAAAPASMRALGTAEQERVDIALTITALLRSGVIKGGACPDGLWQ
jgi:asparagine synthetase B (glutamine-hydrolysing)